MSSVWQPEYLLIQVPTSHNESGKEESPKGKRHKKGQKKAADTASFNFLNLGLMVIVLGLAILFAYTSADLQLCQCIQQCDPHEW